MSYVNIWVHATWSTKRRHPFLTDPLRGAVINHISENAKARGIKIWAINGWVDHLHCLIYLSPDQCIADVVQYLKGESSFWINAHHLIGQRFSWGGEYYAASVDKSGLPGLKHYIRNQERHHSKGTDSDESEKFDRDDR